MRLKTVEIAEGSHIVQGGQLAAIVFDVQLSDDDPLVHHGGSL
jgi:hypothetical protein